ncbi:MAG: hypothetical protein KH431_03290 [Erysipelotrichaceae bacterium]|nr:hypothetical protein [Erysipelotrichaceae bacterium]
MRKFLLMLMIAGLTAGCSAGGLSDREREEKYNEYIQTVEDNKGAVSQNIPFRYDLDVTKAKNGEYEYTVTIDKPQIAMYDIEAIIVDSTKVNTTDMMPNLGIIDDEDAVYNMIPFQVNAKRGFHKGIQLNGYTKKNTFTLQVMVTWKDYAKLNTSKAFFNFSYDEKKAKQKTSQTDKNHEKDTSNETGEE